jgi:energy-coupling factor transporter ATP-binding protein EcfA2
MSIRRQCEPPTDNCPVTAAAYELAVLGFFERKIHRSYVAIMSPRPVFHAAAVATRDGCILLPGESGSGKSTLAGLLVRRGMDYIGDEVVCVEPRGQARTCDHLSKALSMKAGSFEIFSDIAPCASFKNAGEEIRYVDPEHLRADCLAREPVPVAWIVFPRFVAGSAPALRPLTAGETILGLNGSTASTGVRVDSLIELSQRARGYRLEYGSSEEGCQAVFDLVGAKEEMAC